MGAAQRLAVDRHRPLPWPLLVGASAVAAVMALAAGQPGADGVGQGVGVQPGQGAADGGLGRDGEAAGGVVAGAEGDPDWLGRISGPFGDRGDRPGAGQHRGGGQGQDGDQRVAAATGSSPVGDAGQVGQQVRGFGVFELAGIGVGELGDRG
jgi:hypothetical protein